MTWKQVGFDSLVTNGTYRLYFNKRDVPPEYYVRFVIALFELKGNSYNIITKRFTINDVEIQHDDIVLTLIVSDAKTAIGGMGGTTAAIPFAVLIEILLGLLGALAVYLILDKIEKLVIEASAPAVELGKEFKISNLAVIGVVTVVALIFILLK